MVASYAPLLLMFVIAGLVVLGFFAAGHFLGPRNPNPVKQMPFEAGNPSSGAKHLRISVKFFTTAISFVIFDVEVVFLYLWAAEFRSLGWSVFAGVSAFLAMLLVGLLYEVRKGALEWHK